MKYVTTIFAVLAGSTYAHDAHAQAYTPEQAMYVFREAIRETVLPTAPANSWFSLTMVGAVAEPEDMTIVNDLANFCPEPSPVIASFKRVRQLDRIYQSLLTGMVGPLRTPTPEYTEARNFLFKDGDLTPEYKAYNAAGQAFAEALSNYQLEKDAGKKGPLLQKVLASEQNWMLAGYRGEVDAALLQIEAGETKFGPVKLGQRNRVLQWYKSKGLIPSDTAGAYRAPASDLSPPVSTWSNENGWLSVTYSNTDTTSRYSVEGARKSGFGGLSLGFVNLVGSTGGGNTTESRVSEVKTFSYSFEVKRVQISRPWLDTEVFFEPGGWTWKKNDNTTNFPHVSDGVDGEGIPVVPTTVMYNNARVDCALLPSDLVIARKRTLVATVSKSDYELIQKSGSSGGGGSLFGIFGGGGSRSWSSTKISENGNDVTFKVESAGIAVIGVVSEIIPKAPSANPADTWPESAWRETAQ